MWGRRCLWLHIALLMGHISPWWALCACVIRTLLHPNDTDWYNFCWLQWEKIRAWAFSHIFLPKNAYSFWVGAYRWRMLKRTKDSAHQLELVTYMPWDATVTSRTTSTGFPGLLLGSTAHYIQGSNVYWFSKWAPYYSEENTIIFQYLTQNMPYPYIYFTGQCPRVSQAVQSLGSAARCQQSNICCNDFLCLTMLEPEISDHHLLSQ